MDLHHNIKVAPALSSVSVTATGNGLTVDTQGFLSAELIVNAGIFAFDGSNNVSIKLQHGDESDLSDAADVTAADLLGADIVLDNAADDVSTFRQGYIGKKRYIRSVHTVVGTVAAPIGMEFILGHPKRGATAEQDASN